MEVLETILVILTAAALGVSVGKVLETTPAQLPKAMQGWRMWALTALALLLVLLALKAVGGDS